MKKNELIEQLHKKKLVIRGAGALARQFYHTYGSTLDIAYCTTNCLGECLEGLSRIEMDQILENSTKYFIIVCVRDYDAVSFELISEGLMPGWNFLSSEMVAGLVDKKKLFFAIGQCELEVTHYIFQNMSLTGEYVFLYYDEYKVLGIMGQKPLLQWVLEVNVLIEMADYFIFPVNLSNRGDYYNRLLGKVNADCHIVRVPLSTFEGYWPQDCAKNYYEKSPYYLSSCSYGLRRDMNIEKAFENGTEDNILQNIAKENFYETEVICRGFERTIKKFEIMERKADLQISDYYRENYKYEKLFLDRGHAAGCVLKEYAKRILKKSEIVFDVREIEEVDLSWYDDCHMEFPIYPSVKGALCLKDNSDKYRLIDEKGVSFLSFEEYMEIVYRYVKKGMEYMGGR